MRVLIIEDEHFAAERMMALVKKNLQDATIVGVLDSVEESIEWLSSHVDPDLIFIDIQLADGLSFQIFESVKVSCPLIFTTAYDEYALQAFKVNSIDYLLKPIEESAFVDAMKKYNTLFQSPTQQINWKTLAKEVFAERHSYKQRYLVKKGSAFSYLQTSEIAYIFSEDGLSFALTVNGDKSLLDHTLDQIEAELDPTCFFRISRKYILALPSIEKIHPYLNSRLKVDVNTNLKDDMVVSREKVKAFKLWLDT